MNIRRIIALCLLVGLLFAVSAQRSVRAKTRAGSAPATTLTFDKLTFGPTAVGSMSAAQKVILTNTGSDPLDVHVTTSDEAVFPVREDCPARLDPAERCGAVVVFIPAKAGPVTGMIDFGVHAAGAPHTVAISATGIAQTK